MTRARAPKGVRLYRLSSRDGPIERRGRRSFPLSEARRIARALAAAGTLVALETAAAPATSRRYVHSGAEGEEHHTWHLERRGSDPPRTACGRRIVEDWHGFGASGPMRARRDRPLPWLCRRCFAYGFEAAR
jgi:hypothetical protein